MGLPYAERYRVVRFDMRGFGQSPPAVGTFSLVRRSGRAPRRPRARLRRRSIGMSLGGAVAMETTIARPDLVSRLVLVGSGLRGFEMNDETKAGWEEEEAALERGDDDEAVEINMRMWVDGPSRSPDQVDPDLRRKIGEMQRRAIDLWRESGEEDGDHQPLAEDWGERLREISVPTLDPRRRARPARDARDSRSGSRRRYRMLAARRSPAPRTLRTWSARTSSTGSSWTSCRELARGDRARRPDLGSRPEPSGPAHGRRPLARLAGRAGADARAADEPFGARPRRLRADVVLLGMGGSSLAPGGDCSARSPPMVFTCSTRPIRARSGASSEATRPRARAVRRRLEVGHDARDAVVSSTTSSNAAQARSRRSPIRASELEQFAQASATSSGSSTANRRSAAAIRRCRRSGSCPQC